MKKSVFLDSIAVGILLFLLIHTISQTTVDIQNYLQRAIHGKTFLGDAILFSIIFALGFGGSLVILIRRKGKGEAGVVLASAIGVGLIDLGQGINMGQDFSANVIPLSALIILVLLLRYSAHFFGITAPMWEKEGIIRPALLVGLTGAVSASLGGLLGSIWVSEHLRIALVSAGAGFLLFGLLKLIHRSDDREQRAAQIGGLLIGFFLILVIETVFLLLSI